jgi:nucleotidyltransferase/DNA polymerase involved in DNA repair
VTIHIVDLKMTVEPDWGMLRYEEVDMETCVLKLQTLAEMLVRVLRRKAKSLRTIVVEWKDDFPDEDWEMKASVLFPFGTLKGVQMQLGKLIVAERGREKIRRMLEQTLDGLSEDERDDGAAWRSGRRKSFMGTIF